MFRAWDNKEKRMINMGDHTFSVEEGCDSDILDLAFFFSCLDNPKEDRYIVMQYTGLKDKNKNKIFKDDILKVFLDKKRGYIITKVWYMAPEWMLANYKNGKHIGTFQMTDWGYGVEVDDFEVLGNAHENEDLLNNTKV